MYIHFTPATSATTRLPVASTVHVYTQIYMDMNIHIPIHFGLHRARLYIYIYVYRCMYMYIYVNTFLHICKYISLQPPHPCHNAVAFGIHCACLYISIYVYTYVYTYVYICKYIFLPPPLPQRGCLWHPLCMPIYKCIHMSYMCACK